MIYFQKGIFIYTSSRGGLGEVGGGSQACFNSGEAFVSPRFLFDTSDYQEFKAVPLLWNEQLWHLEGTGMALYFCKV